MNFTVFRRQGKGALVQILFLSLLTPLLGCERTPSATAERADSAEQAEQAEPTNQVEQDAEQTVVTSDDLPAKPARIISLAPNVTEILFDLGAGDRIVGVTRFCDYPPEAKEIPKVGGIVDTDLEAIIARRPDLVVGTISGADPKIANQLDDAGVAYGFVRMDNLEQTYRGIEKIGEFIGEARAGGALAAEMKASIDKMAEPDRADQRPQVLMVYGRKPLVAAGPGTFGHELIELAGGQNVLADAETSYPKLDIEKVISLDPERIIDASTMAREGKEPTFWTQYASIDAVEHGQIHLIDDPVVLRPAPRLVEGFEIIRRAVKGEKG